MRADVEFTALGRIEMALRAVYIVGVSCLSQGVTMYYVYVLARPNNEPFYVGKGKDYRITKHETEARSGHDCHKCHVIRKIWQTGGQVQRYTVFTTEDEDEAFAHEQTLIMLYGRETLTNQTDGGEGASGLKWSDEAKTRHSDRLKRIYASPQLRKKLSEVQSALRTPERNTRTQAALRELWGDPKYREAALIRAKESKQDPEYRERVSRRLQEQWQDPTFRDRVEQSRKDNDFAGKVSAASKERWSNPEYHDQLAAGMKERWQDPEYRERALEGIRNRATPEYRAKMSAAVKAARARKREQGEG